MKFALVLVAQAVVSAAAFTAPRPSTTRSIGGVSVNGQQSPPQQTVALTRLFATNANGDANANGASPKKVLVLGGDGFCGWPTSLYLSDKGHDVVVVDNLSRRNIDIELGCDSLTPIQSMEVSWARSFR
jgi:hypothetical protein